MSDNSLSLLAVHISDGVLATPWLAGGVAGAAILLASACWRMPPSLVPRIGVFTAAFFIGSTIHFKLVIASVHLILNGLVGVVLGRRAPIAITIGLMLQFLLLAHGGLWTLGINACIIGVPALLAGQVFPLLRHAGVPLFPLGFVLGVGTAGVTVGLNYFVLLAGGVDNWERLAQLVLLANTPVVIVEGVILGVVVRYLGLVKPELLRPVENNP